MTPFLVNSDDTDVAALEEALSRIRARLARHRQAIVAARTVETEAPSVDPLTLGSKAAAIYAGRRARERIFEGLGLFAEPAWDILLDLFVAQEAGRDISISSACVAAAVPATTALRWIEVLERDGLLEREPDSDDRRRCYLRLTERGAGLVARAVALS